MLYTRQIVRLYGKVVNEWKVFDYVRDREITRQIEVAYSDFDVNTCEVVAVGTEDFTPERYHNTVNNSNVFIWDGIRRNKGGYRWFDDTGFWKYRKSEKKLFKQYMSNRFKAEFVQIRYTV